MCGIVGSINTKSIGPLLERMITAIAHRGPDYVDSTRIKSQTGFVDLGHCRLSIIDLDKRSNQPFEYQHVTITYNGEIYNYIELQKELEELGFDFHTSSDTEVICAAYLAWGPDCVKKFKGMWSFAIWDQRSEELFCSRDRFGIKPFFYICRDSHFTFASEIKALQLHPDFSKKLNTRQVSRFVQLGWLYYGEETFFQNCMQLPAAHNLIYSKGKLRIWRYWDISPSCVDDELTIQEASAKFRHLLNRSIEEHLRSDVEVGGCLSGGIDSSVIASIVASQHKIPFSTFTIYYQGESKREVDEREFVREVAKAYPVLAPHFYSPSQAIIEESFNHFLDIQDFPSGGSSPISQYFVMRLAKDQGMKVLLDGQGADEYLAGYMHSFYRHIADQGIGIKGYSAFCKHVQMGGYQGTEALKRAGKTLAARFLSEQQLYALEYRQASPFLSRHKNIPFSLSKRNGSRLSTFLYNQLFTTQLPNLLHYEDRNSMAFGIEARVPFLDHKLVEYAFSLNNSFKISSDGMTKNLLREATKDVLPKKIYERKDKKGFITPGETIWLSTFLAEMLDLDKRLDQFIDLSKANQLIRAYKQGDSRQVKLIWRLASLNRWIKHINL